MLSDDPPPLGEVRCKPFFKKESFTKETGISSEEKEKTHKTWYITLYDLKIRR